jgi:hypothetical protein
VSDTYATGFYRYGDPLGTALGGEAITRTLRLELDLAPSLSATTWVHSGLRPFRDWLSDWLLDHPNANPDTNRFFGIQQTLTWARPVGWKAELGAAWERQSAVLNEAGRVDRGTRWFLDLGYRWAK